MPTRSRSPSAAQPSDPQRHQPAVPVLIAVAAGIVADWYFEISFDVSIYAATLSVILWLAAMWCSMSRLSAGLLLVSCALISGAGHHCKWSLVAAEELLAYATDQARPVHLLAVVETVPVLIPAKPSAIPTGRPPRDRTIADIQVRTLITAAGPQLNVPVAGRVRLDVQGRLPTVQRGSTIEVWGTLARPGTVRNPGGFDFRLFLREHGIHTIVRCEFAECIAVRSPPPVRWLPDVAVWQSVVAERFRRGLSSENAPLAIALLLGPRGEITLELKEAFLQSGMMHFLAISGINVAILLAFLLPLIRLTRWPRIVRLILVAICVVGYLLLTDRDPPVVRATILVLSLLASLGTGSPLTPLNPLAIAALIILALNPHDLFQAGAQLSFLAILALQWLISLDRSQWDLRRDPLDEVDPSWLLWTWNKLCSGVWKVLVATCAVWLFSLPLVMARFHLVSPVGFLANIILSVWMTVTLCLGYVCLTVAIICPPLLSAVCVPFDWSLSGFTWIVRRAAEVPWGHFKLPGPPDAWLAVFYTLIIAAGSGLLAKHLRRWTWRAVVAWCLAGMIWGLWPETRPGLRVTFLSVGHGAAVLLELPNRQTLLYDAGSLLDGARAQQTVESALLARGKTRLDAVVISHPDVDHFNAVHGLLKNIPIGSLLVSPTFLDFTEESVRVTCHAARAANVPVRLIWSGDRFRSDPNVDMTVMQPSALGFGDDDNANSVVLSIRYAGHSLLLTGDLEKMGLQSLLMQPPAPHDILLAPHHGSLKANPPDLARWSVPRWVIVSGGETALDKLQQNYGDGVTLLSTWRQGAVTFDISPEGEVNVTTQLMRPVKQDQLP